MRKLYFILVLIHCVSCILNAQVSQNESGDVTITGGNSGSPFSALGLGDIILPGFGPIGAMGGTGIGLSQTDFVNTANPAALNGINGLTTMIFDLGMVFEGSSVRAGNDTSPFQLDGGISTFNLWFRLNRFWSSNLGLQPYSNVGYNILDDRYHPVAGGDYKMVYTGKGGVNKLFWGNGFQITPNLSFGVNLNMLFGTISKTQTLIGSSTLGSFTVEEKNRLLGFNYEIGVQYEIPMGEKNLSLGLVYSAPINLSSSMTRQLKTQIDTLNLSEILNQTFRIPHKLGAGFSFKASKNFTFSSDYSIQPWSKGKLNEGLSLLDSWTFSMGTEYIPFYNKMLRQNEQTKVFAGFRLQKSYLDVGEKQNYEWQASVGLDIPFNRFQNRLNLSYTYKNRGTSQLMEAKHKININISFRDIWFVKPKFH